MRLLGLICGAGVLGLCLAGVILTFAPVAAKPARASPPTQLALLDGPYLAPTGPAGPVGVWTGLWTCCGGTCAGVTPALTMPI